jgi:hypothetical protein
MAASIPILRVLVHDVKKSFSSRRFATGNSSGGPATSKTKPGTGSSAAVVTVGRNGSRTSDSEHSLFAGKEAPFQGHIMRTDDYNIEFSRKDWTEEKVSGARPVGAAV